MTEQVSECVSECLTLHLALLFGREDTLHTPEVSYHESLGLQELVIGHLPRLLQVCQLSPLSLQQTTHCNTRTNTLSDALHITTTHVRTNLVMHYTSQQHMQQQT